MTQIREIPSNIVAAIDDLRQIGREFYARGWSLATSSNYSVVVDREPLRLLITSSGKDKGRLGPNDFVCVDGQGQITDSWEQPGESLRPSAETMLHVALAADPEVNCVLHTHSIWATVLSDVFAADGAVTLSQFEMLKALRGINTHESEAVIRIFENTQDMGPLASQIQWPDRIDGRGLQHGFLMRRHGLYTWGQDIDDARRHVEAIEFLFEALGRQLSINPLSGKALAAGSTTEYPRH